MASPPPLHEGCVSSISSGAMGWAAKTHIWQQPGRWRGICDAVSAHAARAGAVPPTSRAMAQMKAASSRAMAVATNVDFLP